MEFCPAPEADRTLWQSLSEKGGLGRGDRYAVLHAGGNWTLKRWPVDYFVQWIRLWRKEFQEKIILCGTLREAEIADKIQSHFSKSEVLSLCGKTSFDELACLLKNARFLLSNDSGPIHLAATQKTKIIGIFGPTSPAITGPVSEAPMKIFWKDVGCEVPCYYNACHYRVCMEWTRPEEVFKKTKELISCHE
jgi:ADP-heptose:LPS heptosyltransferase